MTVYELRQGEQSLGIIWDKRGREGSCTKKKKSFALAMSSLRGLVDISRRHSDA